MEERGRFLKPTEDSGRALIPGALMAPWLC